MVKGPVFCNLLLADEINQTGPKTQAALLEAMEERQTTIHGTTYKLAEPFFVVATQNPIEYEGTYPLPEAQLDRFMFKLVLDYPTADYERQILHGHIPFTSGAYQPSDNLFSLEQLQEKREDLTKIVVEDSIIAYITELIRKTREMPQIQLGASPRAGIAVMMASKAWAYLEGRGYVTPDDVKVVLRPALRHRIILSPQAELEGATRDQIIQEALSFLFRFLDRTLSKNFILPTQRLFILVLLGCLIVPLGYIWGNNFRFWLYNGMLVLLSIVDLCLLPRRKEILAKRSIAERADMEQVIPITIFLHNRGKRDVIMAIKDDLPLGFYFRRYR